ncbi:MAG: glycosyltransferase family 2 protein [Chloroflexaceae bacterium]|nr:glycosyltransferase family 2 protein [Chloroflexaceae bacterium]
MSHSTQTVSVVLRTYTAQRWPLLLQAVDTIRAQTHPVDQIVLVVDHNPELYARACATLPDVHVVENSEPQGSAGAWNSGVAAAWGSIIAFTDDDALADPDWIEQLLRGYTQPTIVGVGGTIEPLWVQGRPAWFPAEFDWVVGCTYRGMPEHDAPIRNLIGCNMSFRGEVLRAVGAFREGIGHVAGKPVGGDETELCIRLRQQFPHYTLLQRPAARVRHHVPASRATWAYFRARCALEGYSKAVVTRYVGAQHGLSSERSYTFKTLPRGVLRGCRDALRGDLSGVRRAAAIISGLGITSGSYARTRISAAMTAWWQHRHLPAASFPVQ